MAFITLAQSIVKALHNFYNDRLWQRSQPRPAGVPLTKLLTYMKNLELDTTHSGNQGPTPQTSPLWDSPKPLFPVPQVLLLLFINSHIQSLQYISFLIWVTFISSGRAVDRDQNYWKALIYLQRISLKDWKTFPDLKIHSSHGKDSPNGRQEEWKRKIHRKNLMKHQNCGYSREKKILKSSKENIWSITSKRKRSWMMENFSLATAATRKQ